MQLSIFKSSDNVLQRQLGYKIKSILYKLQWLFTYSDFTYPDAHLSGQFWSEENSKFFEYVLNTNILYDTNI